MARLLAFASTIFLVTTPRSTSATGAQALLTEPGVQDDAQPNQFAVEFELTCSGIAGGGTAKLALETSWNGTDWIPVAESSVVNANGKLTQVVDPAAPSIIGPYVRAQLVVAATCQVDHAKVRIIASRRFKVT